MCRPSLRARVIGMSSTPLIRVNSSPFNSSVRVKAWREVFRKIHSPSDGSIVSGSPSIASAIRRISSTCSLAVVAASLACMAEVSAAARARFERFDRHQANAAASSDTTAAIAATQSASAPHASAFMHPHSAASLSVPA